MAEKKGSAAGAVVNSEKTEQKFSKEQIAASARYVNRKDLVDALLEKGKKYTIEEVDRKIEEFMKGKVN